MQILHIADGWEATNGAAKVARLIADEQRTDGATVRLCRWASIGELQRADEVWIHCAWKPCLWWATLWARRTVRMPHGSYDPLRLAYHAWKKRLVGRLEHWALRRAVKVVVTCAAEADWVRAYEPGVRAIATTDLKRFFQIDSAKAIPRPQGSAPLHILYLGRRHPLKGVECLERAVAEINRRQGSGSMPKSKDETNLFALRIVSNHCGEELERDWAWCDILCLPTLSENFGLVVAEALERGKRVLVTDGAPAWEPRDGSDSDFNGRLRYLRGFAVATGGQRITMLVNALTRTDAFRFYDFADLRNGQFSNKMI